MRQFASYMLYDFEKYFPESVHLQHTALFFTAHATLLEGKKSEALTHYRTLAVLIQNGELDLMRSAEFLPDLLAIKPTTLSETIDSTTARLKIP
jgi:hypothetical protein